MQIAVLGMGRMGRAVAGRLLDGAHDVVVWNRSPDKAGDVVEKGAREASSPTEAVRGAEVVVTSLTADDAVLEIVEHGGENGAPLASGFGPETVLAEMSTVSPETSERVSKATENRSLASPILGAPAAVSSGQASYLVAGPRTYFDRLEPVYSSLSDHVQYFGDDVKAPLEMKLLANYLLLSGIAVLGEMVPLAQAVGLPDDVLRNFLESSPLVAPALRNRLGALLSGEHEAWFTTTLGAKDVRLAVEMANRHGLELPIAKVVEGRYEQAGDAGYAEADLTAVSELVRRRAG